MDAIFFEKILQPTLPPTHQATIRAHTDGNLYVLHRDDFLKLAAYFPEVNDALMKSNENIIRGIAKDRSHTPLAHCVCVCVCVYVGVCVYEE